MALRSMLTAIDTATWAGVENLAGGHGLRSLDRNRRSGHGGARDLSFQRTSDGGPPRVHRLDCCRNCRIEIRDLTACATHQSARSSSADRFRRHVALSLARSTLYAADLRRTVHAQAGHGFSRGLRLAGFACRCGVRPHRCGRGASVIDGYRDRVRCFT